MTKRTGTIFMCDSPVCTVTRHGSANGEDVEGFHGSVLEVASDGSGARAPDWYACKAEHVASAICGALDRVWNR